MRAKTSQLTCRVTEDTLKLIRERAEGRHAIGLLVENAVLAYLGERDGLQTRVARLERLVAKAS